MATCSLGQEIRDPKAPDIPGPKARNSIGTNRAKAARPKTIDQAALIVAGSIFTPGPIVEEIAMRLT